MCLRQTAERAHHKKESGQSQQQPLVYTGPTKHIQPHQQKEKNQWSEESNHSNKDRPPGDPQQTLTFAQPTKTHAYPLSPETANFRVLSTQNLSPVTGTQTSLWTGLHRHSQQAGSQISSRDLKSQVTLAGTHQAWKEKATDAH